MRTLVVGLAAVATFAVAAAPAHADATGSPYNSGDLTAAVMNLLDVPRGWDYTSPITEVPSVGRCNGPPARTRAERAGMISAVSTAFAGDPEKGPRIDETIYLFPGRKGARRFVSSSERATFGCKSYETPNPSLPSWVATTRSRRLPFPKLGHESFAVRDSVTTTKPGVDPWVEEVVYVRLDNAVITLGVVAADVEKGAFEPVARAAVRRLRSAL